MRPAYAADQRRTALVMLGMFVLSFVVILAVLWQLILGGGGTRQVEESRAAPTPFAIPPGTPVYASLADFEKSPRGSPGSPFAIVIPESELNGRITAGLAKQPDLPFSGVTARILEDRLDFSGRVKAGGIELASTVGLRPFAERGRLAYEVTSINLGPVPVPGVARQAISDTIDRELEKARLTDGFILDAIQATDGRVTLLGRLR